MTAASLLFASLAPSREWVTRRFLCGCVARGYWTDTANPPLRWWIGFTVRRCEAHAKGRVGGGEE